MKITVDMMMAKDLKICYSRDQVEALWGDNCSLTLMEISEFDIPVEDRIWAITRFLDNKSNRLFAADCSERLIVSIENATLKKQNENLIVNVRMFAHGKITAEQLAAYRAAYGDANRASYWAAYWVADWDATRASYWAEVGDAYWAAVGAADGAANRAANRAAYWAAVGAADGAAERTWQLKKIREYISAGERDLK